MAVATTTAAAFHPRWPAFAEEPPAAPAVRTLGSTLEATAALPPTSDRVPLSLALRPEYVRVRCKPPLLSSRLLTPRAPHASQGMESGDILYPTWALGKWTAVSTLSSVLAPAGEDLFSPGRNGTEALRRARLEVGQPLEYAVRWREADGPGEATSVVVDREYNTASISRATMGPNAVQNTQADGPDRLSLVLRPDGAPASSLYRADLRVVQRRTDPYPLAERPNFFACAETTRQTVVVVAGDKASGPRSGPLIKEIDTICTYELDASDPKIMRGYQRTATFLVPDAAYTGDPSLVELAASRLARAPNGRLVASDVRVYELVYRRA